MKSMIQSVKGARDFYPEQLAVRNWLYQKIRSVSELFGYIEYDGPFLEKIDLYAAKSGEELVKEQSFVFPDRGGDLIALRPELTPSLARMIAQKQNELVFPLRWWSFGPFWRYERPQKGRSREFFQWNADLIGTTNPESDAELILVCIAFFRSVGLGPDQVRIKVNDRRLMDAQIAELGVPVENKKVIFRLIDRRDKMSADAWDAYALEQGLSPEQLAGLKNKLSDAELWKHSAELRRLFAVLEAAGGVEYVDYDAGVIRGLEYYTGTVFEAFEATGEGRAILGGGRYDNLLADVGGEPLPGVGFAMGDVMVSLVLEKLGKIPAFCPFRTAVLVTVFDETRLGSSFQLAAEIRAGGFLTISYPEAVKLPKQLKYADRIGARFVVICGPDEEASGKVTVKDLEARTQETIDRGEIVAVLKKFLA